MTTTEQIHEIVDHFGGDNKLKLMRKLKNLRKTTRVEVFGKLNKTIKEINKTYG